MHELLQLDNYMILFSTLQVNSFNCLNSHITKLIFLVDQDVACVLTKEW